MNVLIRVVPSLLIVATLSACLYSSRAPLLVEPDGEPGDLLIQNARLFTGKPGDAVRGNVDLLIRGGRIVAIGAGLDGGAARVFDAAGRTVTPGLVDAHTHITSPLSPPWMLAAPTVERTLAAFLYGGTTTVLDQGSLRGAAAGFAEQERAGEMLSPRIYHSGRPFAAVDGHPASMIKLFVPWPVSTFFINASYHSLKDQSPDEIKALVATNKAAGAAYTKIYFDEIPLEVPVLMREQIKAIAFASKAADLPVMIHVGREEHVNVALDAGVRIFVHGPYRSRMSRATVQRMADLEVVMAPTVTVFDGIVKSERNEWKFTDMDLAILDERELRAWRERPEDFGRTGPFADWLEEARKFETDKFDSIVAYRDAGVRLLVATDSPNFALFSGSAMHRELETFVRLGWSPTEALQAATYHPGRIVEGIRGGEKGLGHIRAGGPADLLIVDGRPDENIADLQKIHRIVLKGRLLKRRQAQ